MKKVILIMCLAFAFSQTTNAQISYGVKGGLNYNNNGDATIYTVGKDIVKNSAKAKSGFHAGVWLRAKIPLIGLYVRPEIVYTQVKSEYVYKNIRTDYTFKKIDVPVLIGKKFLGIGNAFIGPSFQYIIDDNFAFSSLSTDDFDKFSIGLQMGVGVELGKLGVDVRWERGLSSSEAKFTNVTVDNRTNQIILGLSLKL
ncbi:MAG: porin family protein [Polaribacter sp.]